MRRVSVIVCCYNDAPSVSTALESIQRQTLPLEQYEVVFIDDGSLDGTAEAVRPFRQQANFHYVRHPRNLGLVPACNRGLAEATGEYVIRLDADDTFMPTVLEEMRAVLDGGTTDLVYSDRLERVHEQALTREVRVGRGDLFKLIAIGVMMRRKLMLAIGGYRQVYLEEHDLHLRYLLHSGKPPHYIPRPLVTYTIGQGRMTSDPVRVQRGWDELARLWPEDVLRRFGWPATLEGARKIEGLG